LSGIAKLNIMELITGVIRDSPEIPDELQDSITSNQAIVTEVSSRLVAHGHVTSAFESMSRLVAHGHVTSAFESMSCHTFQS
jgi:hypothetical protein